MIIWPAETEEEKRIREIFGPKPQPETPPEPVGSRNVWNDPVVLQAMLPVFTEIQGMKAELARYRTAEAEAKAAAAPEINLSAVASPVDATPVIGAAGPDAMGASASPGSGLSATGGGMRGPIRVAMNGPLDGLATSAAPAPPAVPTPTPQQFGDAFAPPGEFFSRRMTSTARGDGGASYPIVAALPRPANGDVIFAPPQIRSNLETSDAVAAPMEKDKNANKEVGPFKIGGLELKRPDGQPVERSRFNTFSKPDANPPSIRYVDGVPQLVDEK